MFQRKKQSSIRKLLGLLFGKKKQHINALRVSLASPEDLTYIAQQRKLTKGLSGTKRRNYAVRGDSPELKLQPGDQVLKVEFPEGGILAGITLNIAKTQAQLNQQLGRVVPWAIFPVMTVRDCWSFPGWSFDKIPKLVALQLAHLLSVDGRAIAALMGELAGSESARFSAEHMGFFLGAKHLGEPIRSAPDAGNIIYKEKFLEAHRELLVDDMEPHFWDGAMAFGEYLEPGMEPTIIKSFERF